MINDTIVGDDFSDDDVIDVVYLYVHAGSVAIDGFLCSMLTLILNWPLNVLPNI